jgi:hypothetical protein
LEGSETGFAGLALGLEILGFLSNAAFWAGIVVLLAELATESPSDFIKKNLPFFSKLKWLMDQIKGLLDYVKLLVDDAVWSLISSSMNTIIYFLQSHGIN